MSSSSNASKIQTIGSPGITLEMVNHQISSHLREAFIVFDSFGQQTDICAELTWKYFSDGLKGKDFFEFLNISSGDKEAINLLFNLLRDGTVQFSTLTDLLPLAIRSPKIKCELSLNYVSLEDDDGNYTGFVLLINDQTEIKVIKEQAEEAVARSEMIKRIVSDPVSFQSWINSVRRLCLQMKNWESEFAINESIDNFVRSLHTIKGNASLFSAREFTNYIHTLEDGLLLYKDFPREEVVAVVHEIGNCLEAQLHEFQERNSAMLGSLRRIVRAAAIVDQKTLSKLENIVNRLEDPELSQLFEDTIKTESLNSLFLPVKMSILSFASKKEKKVTVILSGGATRLPCKRFRPILEVLTNVFLNCVDHGIESPSERESLGKSEVGRLEVHFEITNKVDGNWLGINISDDGAGIDLDRLREKLKEKGYPADEWSKQKVAESIFLEGLSTKDEVSTTSGRGLGMAAVKKMVDEEGGKVYVDSQKGQGTRFRFLIPLE